MDRNSLFASTSSSEDSNEITVIKAGTGVLTHSDGSLDRAAVSRLMFHIVSLIQSGHKCIFVSSGAVGSGVSTFHLEQYPQDSATRHACAAIGQARLMHLYTSILSNFNIVASQVLLTARDISTSDSCQCVSDTLARLLDEPCVLPIINENDAVPVDSQKFRDNDMLSYHVARLVGARRLILLTTVDGLLDPKNGQLVSEVHCVDGVFGHVKKAEKGSFSLGGMLSKLSAVKLAVDAGIDTHIAAGRKPERLAGIVDGNDDEISTHFYPVGTIATTQTAVGV